MNIFSTVFFFSFGYVEFSSTQAANKAKEEMAGMDLEGREVRLDVAQPRGDGGGDGRTPRGGRGGTPRGGGRGGMINTDRPEFHCLVTCCDAQNFFNRYQHVDSNPSFLNLSKS